VTVRKDASSNEQETASRASRFRLSRLRFPGFLDGIDFDATAAIKHPKQQTEEAKKEGSVASSY